MKMRKEAELPTPQKTIIPKNKGRDKSENGVVVEVDLMCMVD